MKKKEFRTEMLKPFLVLVLICLAAAGLLAYVHQVTEPIIEENALARAEATRKEVLPSATVFEEVTLPEGAQVDSIYKDAGGAGYVVTGHCYGYHGDVTVTIGFDAEGRITALSADTSSETSGVGTKAGNKDYLDKYLGLRDDISEVALISGATYSSQAVRTVIQNAAEALSQVR